MVFPSSSRCCWRCRRDGDGDGGGKFKALREEGGRRGGRAGEWWCECEWQERAEGLGLGGSESVSHRWHRLLSVPGHQGTMTSCSSRGRGASVGGWRRLGVGDRAGRPAAVGNGWSPGAQAVSAVPVLQTQTQGNNKYPVGAVSSRLSPRLSSRLMRPTLSSTTVQQIFPDGVMATESMDVGGGQVVDTRSVGENQRTRWKGACFLVFLVLFVEGTPSLYVLLRLEKPVLLRVYALLGY